MKKRIFALFLLLSVLCLSACQGADTSATTKEPTGTTTPPPSTPPEPAPIELQKYTPYFEMVQSSDISLANFNLSESEIFKRCPADWHGDDNLSFKEEEVPNILWQWDGMEFNAQYVRTTSTRFGQARRDLTREYLVEGYGTLGYDQKTGDWVTLNFSSSEEIDKNPPTEKLTQEECRVIAQQHIDNYLAMYAPNIDLGTYTFEDMGLRGIGLHKYYYFSYKKIVDGYLFAYASIGCGITEYGSLVYFRRADDYSELEEQLNRIDWELINENLAQTAEDIINQNPDLNITYEIVKGYFEKLVDGSYIYHGGLQFNFSPTESAVLAFIIPV